MTATPDSAAFTWGSTAGERQRPFPCDRYLAQPDDVLYRAVDVEASAAHVYRWLCQLRIAPYSYDLVDNGGRRSPRTLQPGLDNLATGQRVMSIFRLAEFERNRHLTLTLVAPRAVAIFGEIAVTYAVIPQTTRRCRLVVKLRVRYPRRLHMPLVRRLLPWGDLVMMRKQLLTLKELAEQQDRPNH